MVKSHKSFLISLILVSIILIPICAVLFFAQETTFADPTYTITVYANDNNAGDRKGALIGSVPNLTQVVAQDILDANLEIIEEGYEYHYYIYDENSENKLGQQIQDIPVEITANVDVLRLKTPKTYKITWKNADDSTINEEFVAHGNLPAFDGTPVYDDAQYTYTFDSWTPTIVAATADAEYKATYTTELKKYKITFIDFDNEELEVQDEVEYGSTPVFGGVNPTRPADAQYTYSFNGWEPEIVPVTGEATYKAIYSTVTNTYTVLWKNYDGTILETDYLVPYGVKPNYDGGIPLKNADEKYTYSFTNWTPVPSEIKGDTEYTANYSRTEIEYTVTFAAGNKIEPKTIHYGDEFKDVPDASKSGYTFKNWTYNGAPVDLSKGFIFTENVIFYPEYEANEYTITYTLNNTDTVITAKYDQLNVDLKTEALNEYLENYLIIGFYEVTENNGVGKIVAQHDLVIPKMTFANNVKLNFISIPKDKEFATSLEIPRLEGYEVEAFLDGTKIERSNTFKIEEIGNHKIAVKSTDETELYSADIVIKEDFGFESGDEFEDPIKLTYVNATVFVDGKEVDPTTYRIDKNGTHTITVIGVNGYESTYSVKYNNGNINRAIWMISLSSVALVIFAVLLALGRRRVVKYGSD